MEKPPGPRRAGPRGAGPRVDLEAASPAWLRGYVFLGSSVLIAGLFLYTHMLTVRLERQAQSMSRVLADFCAAVTLEALESERLKGAFREVMSKVDFPVVLTDAAGRPYAWRKIGIPPDAVTVEMSQALDPHHPPPAGPLAEILRTTRAMDQKNPPVPMVIAGSQQVVGYVHYGESELLREVRWLPWVEIAAFFLFIVLGFLGFRGAKLSEQRLIWVGMAKETAHQLGTPISSLMGWIEVMRERTRAAAAGESGSRESGSGESASSEGETVTLPRALLDQTISEMESDIERLNKVAFRFSNVGSEPKRRLADVVAVVASTVEYVRKRLPRLGRGPVIVEHYEEVPPLNLNAELIEWVVENLLVNAVDALDKPDGRIEVQVARRRESETVEIRVSDNGRGIPAGDQRLIFHPGYSTKRRGWGLGLTLAKRIVEEYHGGRIWVKESHPGRGTTMVISFPV